MKPVHLEQPRMGLNPDLLESSEPGADCCMESRLKITRRNISSRKSRMKPAINLKSQNSLLSSELPVALLQTRKSSLPSLTPFRKQADFDESFGVKLQILPLRAIRRCPVCGRADEIFEEP